MSTCKHDRTLPNPAGGAWFCVDCGHYPTIAADKPSDIDCAAIIQGLWRERDDLRGEVRYLRKLLRMTGVTP